jgi:Transposase
MGKPYSDDLRERVVAAIEAGHSRVKVAELYNMALSTVGGFVKRKRETGSVSPDKFGGYKTFTEAWLRDTLFARPELIPINDIDSTFGPLVPLCKELRTDAGPIDAVFINERGRLTIVEFKLWKNPQARREVVAQTLDYVSALAGWSYADLQRTCSAARWAPPAWHLQRCRHILATAERRFLVRPCF